MYNSEYDSRVIRGIGRSDDYNSEYDKKMMNGFFREDYTSDYDNAIIQGRKPPQN